MTPCDPMAVAVDWLDAYRAARSPIRWWICIALTL